MKFLKSHLDKLKYRENFLPLLFAVAFTAVFFIDSNFLNNKLLLVMWVLIGVAFTAFASFLFVLAGFTVLKSLFLLSAELSLLIFLVQAYCEVPTHAPNDALKILVGISLLYISFEFFKSLRKALKERLDQIPEKHWSKERVIVVILFSIFTVGFIWMVYQVINPIVMDFCVYKS